MKPGKTDLRQKNQPSPADMNQLITLFNTGRYAELENRALFLLKQYPDSGHVWMGLSLSLQMQGKDALHALQRTAKLMPRDATAHNNLANTLRERGQLDAAVASARLALKLQPVFAAAHNNLGLALLGLGQTDAAVTSLRRAVAIQPNFPEAHSNLGNALLVQGQVESALTSCRRAVELKPDFADAHANLGNALKELGQLDAAKASYRRALQLKPDFAEAHNNLGIALKELGQLDAALASYRRAVQLKPDFAEAYSNMGNALRDIGQLDGAVASCRRALELKPDFIEAHNILLFTLNYTDHTPEYCLAEAREYGRRVSEKVTSRFSTWQCTDRPERLRVGMVSGDLHNHPVGYFLEGLLAQLDPTRIELIAYSTSHITSELTTRIKPYFSAWKPLFSPDAEAARLIHDDGVHVLLDLSGHTAKNRLPMFAWKPAPVQASWLGYFATTGVLEMDYYLADEVSVPKANRGHFSEIVWYLPDTRWCFTAPDVDFPVAPLPALKNGYITFGCFQSPAKVGGEVLKVWGKVLSALPNARLRWQCKQLGDQAVRAQFIERLRQHGIDPGQVTMLGAVSREAYLAAHSEVDVILDTFPFPGGTTTCEALWMGVPTLTLAGGTLLARQGASLLTAAGLGDWVTANAEDYIAKAVTLTSDIPRLAALRAGLRKQVSTSPLYDAKRFAKNFEDALWGMWQARTQRNATAHPELLTASHD